jgi:hypothetical protein
LRSSALDQETIRAKAAVSYALLCVGPVSQSVHQALESLE